jgi:uncharacterized membrane protein
MTYDTSISIDASQEAVWRVLSAVTRWPEWLPTVSTVEPLDGAPLALGSRYRVVQPKLRPGIWKVTVLDPPRRYTWEARWPGVLTVGNHVVERDAPDRSQVTLSISFSGPIGSVIGKLSRNVTERYILQEAASLKEKVERGA